jgi:20S proteasome subunit beta 3
MRALQRLRWLFLTSNYCFFFFFFLLLLRLHLAFAQQQQDPTSWNGGSCLAMAGKDSVVMAIDPRFGVGPQMVTVTPRPVLLLQPNSKVLVALTGMEGDIQTLRQELQLQVESFQRRGGLFASSNSPLQPLSPRAVSSLLRHLLYQRRRMSSPYYVEPVIVGWETVEPRTVNDKSKIAIPYLCVQDVIGAMSRSDSFVCAGVASSNLYGTAEAMWRPNLEDDELLEVCGKAFLSALERDCLSGYGATMYLLKQDGTIEEVVLDSRND